MGDKSSCLLLSCLPFASPDLPHRRGRRRASRASPRSDAPELVHDVRVGQRVPRQRQRPEAAAAPERQQRQQLVGEVPPTGTPAARYRRISLDRAIRDPLGARRRSRRSRCRFPSRAPTRARRTRRCPAPACSRQSTRPTPRCQFSSPAPSPLRVHRCAAAGGRRALEAAADDFAAISSSSRASSGAGSMVTRSARRRRDRSRSAPASPPPRTEAIDDRQEDALQKVERRRPRVVRAAFQRHDRPSAARSSGGRIVCSTSVALPAVPTENA